MRFADIDYPADPYPGRRPPWSFVHVEGVGHRLYPVPPPKGGCVTVHAPSGFLVADGLQDLDRWLADRTAPGVGGRTAVLAYGSNACPAKLTWLRQHLGLRGPVVVLRAECTGMAAVWANGRRTRDGQRPVVLAAAPGVAETHAVLLLDDGQLRVFDAAEGADIPHPRYRRERLRFGSVSVDGDASPPPGLQYYRGVRADRMPLLVDGHPVRAALSTVD